MSSNLEGSLHFMLGSIAPSKHEEFKQFWQHYHPTLTAGFRLAGELERNWDAVTSEQVFTGWLLARAAQTKTPPALQEPIDWVPEIGEEVWSPKGIGRVMAIEYLRGWAAPHSIHVKCYAGDITYHFSKDNVKPWRK